MGALGDVARILFVFGGFYLGIVLAITGLVIGQFFVFIAGFALMIGIPVTTTGGIPDADR